MNDNGRAYLTISRPSYGGGKEAISLSIVDAASGVEFVELEIPLDDFTKCLTGNPRPDIPMITRRLDLVGKRREHKIELVFIPDSPYANRAETVSAALRPHEIDGWAGDKSDATNAHKSGKREANGNYQRITFCRHVDPITGTPIVANGAAE